VHKTNPRRVTRREFMGAAVGAVAAGGTAVAPRRPRRPPNVLYVMADDLGFGDLSCYGRREYRTPVLDRLAAEGVRFTNAYSASPLCTPTRCAFMTGRYPARAAIGLEEPLGWRTQAPRVGLEPDHPTVASLLKRRGYDTALVGKWHLGYLPDYGPTRSGFDEYFGIMSGGANYFTHTDGNGELDLYEGTVPVERVGYMTRLLTDRAVDYVARRGRSSPPFFLSLQYTAPHWPWEGPGDEAVGRPARSGHAGMTAGGSLAVYASMMRELDAGLGRVLAALRARGIERETLVVFTSDNGGERFSFNWPFSGQKNELLEGGIRVPAIVRWPGTVPAGVVTDQVAVTMDWTATILAAAGAAPDAAYPLDGEDLLPVCRRARAPYERALFWRHADEDAVRRGRWKYLRRKDAAWLYDLSVDAREKADFRAANPGVFERLAADFRTWEAGMLPRKKRV
jgi:arylsulfatase A-like enzyme